MPYQTVATLIDIQANVVNQQFRTSQCGLAMGRGRGGFEFQVAHYGTQLMLLVDGEFFIFHQLIGDPKQVLQCEPLAHGLCGCLSFATQC